MKLKEVISLKTQKDIYLVDEAEGEFTYCIAKISKYLFPKNAEYRIVQEGSIRESQNFVNKGVLKLSQ